MRAYEIRAAGLGRLLVGAAVALAITVAGALLADPGEALLRWPGWAAAALAAAAAGLLDDPARPVAAASPARLALRRGVRLGAALPLLAAAWALVLVVAGSPVGGVTLVAAALVALTLGAEAIASRLAAMAVPVVVVTLAVAFDVADAAVWWAAALCCGLATLVWGSRDELRAG
jgi:hypothetical protein